MNTHKLFNLVMAFIFAFSLVGMPTQGARAAGPLCYVYSSAGGANNGTSWADAFTDLQSALAESSCSEIWVAAGTYKPTTGADRSATFQLSSGVGLYGGFAGTETARDQRDWQANVTILSGDIDNNDINFDGNYTAESIDDIQGDNSYHVLTGSGTDDSAVLDGFVVTAGKTLLEWNVYPNSEGGGMFNEDGSPTISHITFSGNSAGWGGGMYNRNSSPLLTDVTFIGNAGHWGTIWGWGAGMYNYLNSNPVLIDVRFINNSVYQDGGAMYNTTGSSPQLTNVTFIGNSAHAAAGMMNTISSSPILTDVTFLGNTADSAPAMYNSDNSSPTLINVLFSGNVAAWTQYYYAAAAITNNANSNPILTNVTYNHNIGGNAVMTNTENSHPVLINTIMWGNDVTTNGQIYNHDTSNAIVTYSIMEGGYPGANNMNAVPLFADANGADDIFGTADDDPSLLPGSPAIDSGDDSSCPASDLRGVTRPQGAQCDIGAYEYEGPFNQPPIADAGGPYTGTVGDSITLDASASSDPEAGALIYEWDLDNDSEYDDATGVTTTTVFDQVGEHTVGLRVTDTFGLTATDTATITVNPQPSPPSFGIWPSDDRLQGTGWFPNSPVWITVDDPTTGAGVDYSVTRDTDGEGNFYYYGYWDGIDFRPGFIVTVDGGGSGVRELVISSLALTGGDHEAESLHGTATPDLIVEIWARGNDVWAVRHETAEGDGTWAANFALPGNEPDEQDVIDLQPGNSGTLKENDADGDFTQIGWNLPNPSFGIWLKDSELHSWGWWPNTQVDVTVDDPSNGLGADFSTTLMSDEWGDVYHGFEGEFNLQPGFLVALDDGANLVREHIVANLVITGADAETDLLYGTADPGAVVNVMTWGDALRHETADDHGNWTANFAVAGNEPDEQNILDLQPNTGGYITRSDEDGDFTQIYWRIPDLRFTITLTDDYLNAGDWWPGAPIEIRVDDPSTPASEDFSTTLFANEGGYIHYALGEDIDLQPGFIVTLDGGTSFIRELTIPSLAITNIDLVADIVYGVTDPNSVVNLWGCADDCADRHVAADQHGNWAANFALPGDEPDEQGTMDLRPDGHIFAGQNDEDGDSVQILRYFRNTTFRVHPNGDWIEGDAWEPNTTVNISFDDPATPANPDYTTSVMSGNWNADPHYFSLSLGGAFDIKPGFHVTASDGHMTKELTVSSLIVNGVNPNEDTVWGIADPSSPLRVHIWCPVYAIIEMESDSNGNWTADFTGQCDLVPNHRGRAEQMDPDGDSTADDWSVRNPGLSIGISSDLLNGWDWTPNAAIQVRVDNPADGPDVDYSTTVNADQQGSFHYGLLPAYNLQPGYIVTLDDGIYTKEHVITNVTATSADAATDTVSGTASPGSLVQVSTCWSNGCAVRHETADQNGNWIANFGITGNEPDELDIRDLQPGIWGGVDQYDADGDYTNVYWQVPNPTFSVYPMDRQIYGWQWKPWATIQIMAGNCPITTIADGSGNFFIQLSNACVLQSGDTITVTDGTSTKAHVIANLVVTAADAQSDTVYGTAAPGAILNVWVCGQNGCTNRHETADVNGNWSANFALTGDQPDEQTTFDLQPGSRGDASQPETDGDSTGIRWRVLNPQTVAAYWNNWVNAEDWPLGDFVTMTIEDLDTPQSPDYSATGTIQPVSWNSNPGYQWWLDGVFDVQPGQVVTITNGEITKTLVVSQIEVTDINEDIDVVSGLGAPNLRLGIWANGAYVETVTGPTGEWAASFVGITDLIPGSFGSAKLFDEDGDSTHTDWQLANPSISVRMLEKRIQGYGWPLGASVTLYLDDPDIPGSPDYTDSQTAGVANWDPNNTEVVFQLGDEIALKPGLLVTMTDGDIVKTHTATNLVVTGVDPEDDTVFGTAEPGSYVHIGHLCENNICAFRYVTVDENGDWIADFAHPGEDSNEQDLFDIRPGTNNEARQHDSDGDATQYGWQVINPFLQALPGTDSVVFEDWPLGATVTLAIEDPSTAESPDYTTTAIVTIADWDPAKTWFELDFQSEYDLKTGDIVTGTDGEVTKDLTVTNLNLGNVDPNTDVITGTAEPGTSIDVFTDDPWAHRRVIADSSGNWSADFSVPGNETWEADLSDIGPGSRGMAFQEDEDEDRAAVFHWYVPNPTFSARLTDNEVHGYEWPLGASVTLRIDDPNTPQPVDYTKSQTTNVSDWDPNQTFVQFRLWEDGFTLDHGMTVTMSDGITSKAHMVTSLTVTSIDPDADTISGTASPGTQVDIGHIYCDDNGCYGYRRVLADSNGNWIADFAHAGEDDDEQDIIDITAGMESEARQCDDDGECTTYGWYVFSYTLHAVPTHPEVHGHDWPKGVDVTLKIDDDTDPHNGTLYTQTKNADDNPWCGSPCFNLSGVFNLQVGQYVTMTDGTVTKTVQVSTLKITSVDMANEKLSGIADPGSDVMVNIWSQEGKARHTVADSNGDWAVDFSVFGDEDFEQFTTDIGYGDNGRAIQLNPDGTDDGTLEYWNQDWVAPDTIPLVVAMSSRPSLDRLEYTLEAWAIYNLLWEPLFRTTDQGTLMPAAASDYTVSPDGLVYTITLRNDLLWSDGQPVTAQHYVDGLLRVISSNRDESFGMLLDDIQGARDFGTGVNTDPNSVGLRALNSETLEITLAHPAVYFLQILADPGMVPARLDMIAQHGDAWIAPQNFVGNGPYTLAEYDGGHLLLQKNLQFHDAANVSIDQIAFDIIEDENERFEAYKRGDVDVLMDAPQSALDDPNFDQERVYSASPGVMYLGLNTQRTPTDNVLVRKALAASIDRRALLDNALNLPWLEEATGVIPPELFGYQGAEAGYTYNPLIAQGFLADAGYPGGTGLPAIHMYGFPRNQSLLEAIADQWRNVLGVSVEVHYLDNFNEWIGGCQDDPGACDYNAIRQGWLIDYYDPHNIINDLFNPDTTFARRIGWDNARYRELIELSRGETNPAQRLEYLNEAEQILVHDDVAVIPLYYLERVSLVKRGFQPVFGIVPYFDRWNYQEVFNLHMDVNPVDDEIVGFDWPVDSEVTLTINDPATPEPVDYTTSKIAHPATSTSNRSVVAFRLFGDFDIQAGHEITLSDGTTTRTIIVTSLQVDEVNANTDTVSGTAVPGIRVYIDMCGPRGVSGCASRQATANGTGQWSVDFTVPGEQDWEQDTLDLIPGSEGTAGESDEDGDATIAMLAVFTTPPSGFTPTEAVTVPAGESIQLATVVDLSLNSDWLGADAVNAVQLAIEDFGSINGFDITQTSFDSDCNEDFLTALNATLEVIANPEYVGVIGHACSFSFKAGLPLYEAAGLVTVSGSSTNFNTPRFGPTVSNRVVLNDFYYDSTLWTPIIQAMPSVQAWNARYQLRFTDTPAEYAVFYYDATMLLLRHIAETAELQPDGSLVINRAELASAVRATENYKGISGCISLDHRGDRVETGTDADEDCVPDSVDNAPAIYNPDQRDVDNDGIADVLDPCPADSTNMCNVQGSVSSVIGSQGGTLTTPDSNASLNIPAGAINEDLSFSITDMGGGYEVATYQGAMSVFQSYSIQPHGTYFNEPATITFHWDDTNNDGVVDGTTLHETHLLLIKDGVVIAPSCAVNPNCNMGSNTLTVQVTELSLFELAVPVLQYASFVVFGQEGIWIKENTDVVSGDVGANVSASGPYLTDQSEVTIGQNVKFLNSESRVMGDTVYLKQGSQVYDVYYNEVNGQGTVLGNQYTPLDLPLFQQLPTVPSVTPGTQNFSLPINGTLTLNAGNYGKLEAKKGATINFTGGVYHFTEWALGDNIKVYFAAPTEIRIAGKLDIGADAFVGPAAGTTVTAHDIFIYVLGVNGNTGNVGATPKAAKFGMRNTLFANVYTPNGTLWIRERSTATGAFFGKWVTIGENVTLTLDNGWH